MGTRGVYGFRMNGVDKLTYNHYDSYPECLGKKVLEFCVGKTLNDLENIYNKIIMVSENSRPFQDQIDICIKNGWYDDTVSTRSATDWYCLLRKTQGGLDEYVKHNIVYMIDNHDFIKDSLFCEYGYIINIDLMAVEFYVGFQMEPQKGNRYGEVPDNDGYYPCKLMLKIPLSDVTTDTIETLIEKMNAVGYKIWDI